MLRSSRTCALRSNSTAERHHALGLSHRPEVPALTPHAVRAPAGASSWLAPLRCCGRGRRNDLSAPPILQLAGRLLGWQLGAAFSQYSFELASPFRRSYRGRVCLARSPERTERVGVRFQGRRYSEGPERRG